MFFVSNLCYKMILNFDCRQLRRQQASLRWPR
jgi:hypothetical protein